MGSAIVYLTLGGIISRQFEGWVTKAYFLSVALLTLLVALSRLYLGVHYPSDVLAGWAAGALWLSACTQAARWLQHQGAVEPPALACFFLRKSSEIQPPFWARIMEVSGSRK